MTDIVKDGQPVWDVGVDIRNFDSLRSDISVDVAIIGGGITGITTAYLLAKEGKKVAILEKNKLAFGATGMTTGFLVQYIDTSVSSLLSMFGAQRAKAVLASHKHAIDLVEGIVNAEHISCEFLRCSNYMFANTSKYVQTLREEEEAAHKVGFDIRLVQDEKLGFPNAGYLELSHQAKFHVRKYLAKLVDALHAKGAQLYENTEVLSINSDDSGVEVITSGGIVHAKHVVVATYAPFDKQLPYRKAFYITYVVEAAIPKGKIMEGMYEDTKKPYHYFRVDKGEHEDRLIIGGEDHRRDIPVSDEKSYRALIKYMQSMFPDMTPRIIRRWKGPILESIDGLAWIGPIKDKNIFYTTGYSGNGITYSGIAAIMARDYIVGKDNHLSQIYNPRRIPTLTQLAHKGVDYTRELIGGAVRNTFFR